MASTLQGADLSGANLRRADLRANLQSANLKGANFQNADLRNASLKGADLRDLVVDERTTFGKTTGLTVSQVKAAENWNLAFFNAEFLKELGLPPDHNETLKKKLAELEKKEKEAATKK